MSEIHVRVSSRLDAGPLKAKTKTVVVPPDYDADDIRLLTRRTVEDTAFAHSDAYTGGAVTKRSLLIQVARLAALRYYIENSPPGPLRTTLIEVLDRDGEAILAEWGEGESD